MSVSDVDAKRAAQAGHRQPAAEDDGMRVIEDQEAQPLRCRPVEFTRSSMEWAWSCVPLADPLEEQIRLADLVDRLHGLLDTCTEADTTPRGVVLHVAHILVSRQGADGAWPAEFNLRTGQIISAERSTAPVTLFRRLNEELNSTEFNLACSRAEAGVGRGGREQQSNDLSS